MNNSLPISPVNDAFYVAITTIPNLLQLRYINATGFEKIGLELNLSTYSFLDQHEMNNVSDTVYDMEIRNLTDKFYLSNINLAFEPHFGQEETIPVIKVAAPINENNIYLGYLIATLDFKTMFHDELDKMYSNYHNIEIALIDNNLYFLETNYESIGWESPENGGRNRTLLDLYNAEIIPMNEHYMMEIPGYITILSPLNLQFTDGEFSAMIMYKLAESELSSNVDETMNHFNLFFPVGVIIVSLTMDRIILKSMMGIRPVCMHCKRIKHPKNNKWMSIEGYISSISDMQFSHGYCDSCYEKELSKFDIN
ncbi:MAG: hypothetical protein INQ03_18115 [Candidatus Heimdallarchaeota archaeon]|nr:hypothetical protein [Candidatus Heimdallarchaeota archaeon]